MYKKQSFAKREVVFCTLDIWYSQSQMHSVGLEPTTDNLEGCSSYPTELRMHVFA